MISIIPEKIIEEIVKGMPTIRLNDAFPSEQPKFGYGNRLELNRWLQVKKDDAYPLIWMLMPFTESHEGEGQEVSVDNAVFVIATRENNKDLFNSERYERSYKVVLNPLTSYLIQGLDKSNLTDLNSREWNIVKYPNYSEANENFTIDLWDAVQLEIGVKFNNNDISCLKQISYE